MYIWSGIDPVKSISINILNAVMEKETIWQSRICFCQELIDFMTRSYSSSPMTSMIIQPTSRTTRGVQDCFDEHIYELNTQPINNFVESLR